MKKIILSLAIVLAGFCAYAQEVTDAFLPQWQKGWLDIHTLATGDGDATFIVFPDGTTMLVDAGDIGEDWPVPQFPNASRTVGEWVVNYINTFSKGTPNPEVVDYMLLTHFHDDHMGSLSTSVPGEHGFRRSGLTMVGDLLPFGKIVDRGYPDYDFPSKEKNLKACNLMQDYWKMIDYQISQKGATAEKFQIGSTGQFPLRYDPKAFKKNFEILNIAASGEVWTGKGLKSKKMYSGDPNKFDENINSTVFRLTYGKFRYYNGGDVSGGNLDCYPCKERNFEKYVADVCGKVNAIKVNHHGWKDNSNAYFLMTLSPEILIVPATNTPHPSKDVMTRLADPYIYDTPREFYITADEPREEVGDELWSLFKPSGHIVIRVYDGGESYQIYVLEKTSEDYHVIYQTGVRNL